MKQLLEMEIEKVVSLTQTVSSHEAKIAIMRAANPQTVGKVVGWALQHWFLL